MAGTKLTASEHEKATILTDAIAGNITNEHAAKQLRLSIRQVQRAKAAIRKGGVGTVAHRLKGKPSNHRFSENEKTKVLETIKQHYRDFKPTFATEKLEENHGLHISRETTRLWMTEAGLWKSRKQRKTGEYRSWRPRKEHFGELEQFDGSYHFWFENRFIDGNGNPIEACLLAAIDDAKGEITKAVFAANEGVIAVFTFWKEYIEELGKPISIYLDKFSTYKINHKAAVDNKDLLTQFERCMSDLDTRLITAHSPQAKGRIERLFDTLQDRLVKELRLAKINTPEEANIFLKEIFIPKFNKKFGVFPTKEGNIHKALTEIDKKSLNRIFSVQETRTINNDFTIQFKNNWYQLAEIQPTTVRAKEKTLVEEWLDGTIHFSLRGKYLNFTILPEKPKKISKQPIVLTGHKLNWKPPKDHPWRKLYRIKR
jgi:transposase